MSWIIRDPVLLSDDESTIFTYVLGTLYSIDAQTGAIINHAPFHRQHVAITTQGTKVYVGTDIGNLTKFPLDLSMANWEVDTGISFAGAL